MRAVWAVSVVWVAVSICSLAMEAQTSASSISRCAPSVLDVQALPPVLNEGQAGHLFVLELQNVGTTACMLAQPSVELLPPSDPYNNLFLAANHPDEGGGSEYAPKRLEPGDWAHLLFAWISQAAPEIMCNHYSELKLHTAYVDPNTHSEDPAAVDVRNLWIRSCRSVYVSGYRKGRYSPQSSLSANWLRWWQPATYESSFPKQPLASQILASPALELHAWAGRIMLGDYLELRLKFPREAADGCALRLLRKRESSGATIISVQQCPAANAANKPVPQYLESGISQLDVRALDMFPHGVGPVEYDVVGPVASSGSASFARAQIKLIARDPTLPAQAAILAPLPPCKAAQLHFVSRDPAVSGSLRTLRAYEATNASSEPCSVAGVPALRFFDEKGINQPFVPKPCPNCDNDLFKARPNGRIDLRPGDTAHFLVGATGIDTQEVPWMHCQASASVELTATANDKPVDLPLAAADCAALDISAWRAGRFDADPQNADWAKTHDVVFREPAAPVPADCDRPELLTRGRPLMLPSTGAISWGFSLASHTFKKGDPIPLYLWLDNSSNAPTSVMTCMDLDYIKARSFELYDAYGHRVLRKAEARLREKCAQDPNGATQMWACTRNFPIEIPARTCVNGDSYDFAVQLGQAYDLPPGEYTVHIQKPPSVPALNVCELHQDAPFEATPGEDITFDVTQP